MSMTITWGRQNRMMHAKIRNDRRKVIADKSRKINRLKNRLKKKGY